MFSTTDTIVAIATAPGRGAIGIVRLSGPRAHEIVQRLAAVGASLAPRHATLTNITVIAGAPVSGGEPIDRAVVTFFPAPNSYTGDDVLEISAHGSPVILNAIVMSAVSHGARIAGRGEFTLRAFLNGRLDLTQAEAVADLIDAATPEQARAAFDQLNGTLTDAIGAIDEQLFDLVARLEASVDFPDEGYHFVERAELGAAIGAIVEQTSRLLRDARRGRLIREGLHVAIVGAPNVGKSSLFNALVGASRAIVTDVPGTTRDLISETMDLAGLKVTLVDTAGLRETTDIVESEGVARSRGAAAVADVLLVVEDLSQPRSPKHEIGQTPENTRVIVVGSKADLDRSWSDPNVVEVSARVGIGLEALRTRIVAILDFEPTMERPAVTNMRHIALIERADQSLRRAAATAANPGPAGSEEFVLADIGDAREALEEITGKRTPDDVLEEIFERFCIGK